MREKMLEKVENYIKENQMTAPQEKVLVALSGGADSVCLLILLERLKERLGICLCALHLNHCLRGQEADRDEQFVRELCDKLCISLTVKRRDVAAYAVSCGMSGEEAGREIRYQELTGEAKRVGAARIAVAHHRDDSAETILYHLFRGTGLKGLGGIEPVRGNIIRPLLCVGRQEILAYLEAEGISYCTDSTNLQNDYARNRIRNRILPLAAAEVNRRAAEHILNAGAMAAEADAYLQMQAEKVLRDIQVPPEGDTVLAVCVDAEAFLRQEPIIRSYVVRSMISGLGAGLKDISQAHIQEVCHLAKRSVGTSFNLPREIRARRGYQTLILEKMRREDTGGKLSEEAGVVWEPEDNTAVCFGAYTFSGRLFLRKKDTQFPENWYTKWFDYDKIKGTLCVRSRKTGDYISLPGGGRKTLKSYMIDEKIPQALRDSIPVVAEGNHVLWIVGYRMSEYYKISDNTRTILEVAVNGGENHG